MGNFEHNEAEDGASTAAANFQQLSIQDDDQGTPPEEDTPSSENSGMWVHGPGSRTMSAVPASTYCSFQGQNQQPAGFRQGQQPSQHFGALGYPNYYHSQSGMSLEQLQNCREGTLGGSQGQQPLKADSAATMAKQLNLIPPLSFSGSCISLKWPIKGICAVE